MFDNGHRPAVAATGTIGLIIGLPPGHAVNRGEVRLPALHRG
jgi:hypothetical protein